MKCTKCGNNEATFHYVENINGKKTEAHLCADCAKEEGYESRFNDFGLHAGSMFGDMFDDMLIPAGFFSNPFEDGFSRMLSPMRSFRRAFSPFPEIQISIGDGMGREQQSEGESQPASDEMKTKREINALKHSLKEAVKAEDYEKCIELRDKIKKLESENN